MIKNLDSIFIALVFFVSLVAVGYRMLFSNFAVADDEGYILISARNYLSHGKLYETIYSQYGPAFYFLLDIVHYFSGATMDQSSARLLTLGLWLGTAVCCAALVWRQTTSRSLSLFTLSGTFLYLYFITDEPFHPGSLIIFVLALSVYIATELIMSGKMAAMAMIAGGTAAVLLLTKINVGIFYLVAITVWALIHAHSERIRRVIRTFVIIGLILFSVVLMHALFREAWVQIYLSIFAVGALTLTVVQSGEPLVRPSHAGWFTATSMILGCIILCSIWLRGTSLPGLYEGIWLGPLLHPINYSYPVDWRPGSLALAGMSAVLALTYRYAGGCFSEKTTDSFLVVIRLIQAAVLLIGVALLMNFRVVGTIFSYVVPLIWTWVLPLKKTPLPVGQKACRNLLATVLLLQYLHAYPVGGSQESWGTFLFIPLVAIGLGDVRQWFGAQQFLGRTRSRTWSVLGTILVSVVAAKVGWAAVASRQTYLERSPLGLLGAGNLRLPENYRTAYRILALNAVVHADMLFSLPGLFSFNAWTDLPTPTEKNATLWFTLLNQDEQQAIIQGIERSPRAGLIVQESLIHLMRTNGVSATGVLYDYLQKNFVPIFRVEGFTFLVKKGRAIAPINIAEVRTLNPANADPTLPDTEVDVNLIHDGEPIISIEIQNMSVRSKLLTLNADNAQVDAALINRSGRSLMAASHVTWPLHLSGPNQLSIRFNRGGFDLSPVTSVLYLKGARNETLGEIRLGE